MSVHTLLNFLIDLLSKLAAGLHAGDGNCIVNATLLGLIIADRQNPEQSAQNRDICCRGSHGGREVQHPDQHREAGGRSTERSAPDMARAIPLALADTRLDTVVQLFRDRN